MGAWLGVEERVHAWPHNELPSAETVRNGQKINKHILGTLLV